jgi:hypothetical protein
VDSGRHACLSSRALPGDGTSSTLLATTPDPRPQPTGRHMNLELASRRQAALVPERTGLTEPITVRTRDRH